MVVGWDFLGCGWVVASELLLDCLLGSRGDARFRRIDECEDNVGGIGEPYQNQRWDTMS